MLGDVVEAALAVGEVRVVTDDPAGRLVAGDVGARLVDDPGSGQGDAVATGLEGASGLCLVVNADLPRRPADGPERARRCRRCSDGSGSSRRTTGRRTRSACRAPTSSRPSTARAAQRGSATMRQRLGIDAEALALGNLVDDVDTLS